ncbi:MAG: RagB/SusD family nutrient uptake outer membrane protein [Dysgonamonadaceae bacterium]|nr:RagB/SusD family nutrient uptake outer membrane protein [Dysgonamonadaceae bacterium]
MNKIFLMGLAVLSLVSCNEWLNLEPEDGVIRDRFWKTKEETQSAVMGCYTSLMEVDMMRRYFVWGEMRAEMVGVSANADEYLIAIKNGEITSDNEYTRWAVFYRTINQCNTVLELATLAKERDLSFSDALLKQFEAEVTCIRSLAYFYLIRTFRDVPYITQASIYDDQPFMIPKTDQEAIVDSLIVSLRAVENNLPASYNDVASTKGRFTVYSLKTLLADIYLWKGDYDNCIDLCTQVIGSGKYSLVPVGREEVLIESMTPGVSDTVYYPNTGDIASLFSKLYVTGNSIESILELQFGTDKENGLLSLLLPSLPPLQAKMDNFTEYFPSSAIDRGWFDIRAEGVSYKQGYVWKWIGLSRDEFTFRQSGQRYANWIFYRLADVILMKAEALTQKAIATGNKQEQLAEAKDLLQQIRTRANAPESTDLLYKQTGAIDGKTLEEFILNERVREFTFEGKRWFDVLRHARRDNYSERNLNYLLRLAILAAAPEKVNSLQSKWQGSHGSHYLPIYFEELQTNKNLIQNEFYGQ